MSEPIAVEIPYAALSEDALARLIEEFVTRDGTDYGTVERSLADKITAIRRQLVRGDAKIMFDPESETANIVMAKGA